MRERIFQAKKAASPVSISTLKQPTRGFGLESWNALPPAMTRVQPLNKPLTHDISKISLRPQAKLSISQPGDTYEQEADSVARQVMQRMALSGNRQSIQRQEIPEEEEELQMKPLDISTLQRQEAPEEEEELQMKPLDISTLQRQEVPEEEEELQMKPMVQRQANGGMAATADLETSINQARGGGQPLGDNIRKPMEQAFGADFGGVKVHTDSHSDGLNRSIQARAFTTGQDIFFRQGEYNPGSRGGQELLAHELTHVVQQNGGMVQRSLLPPQHLMQLPATENPRNYADQRGGGVGKVLSPTVQLMALSPLGAKASTHGDPEKADLVERLINGTSSVEDYMSGVCYDAVAYVQYLRGCINPEQLLNINAQGWIDVLNFASGNIWNGESIEKGKAIGFYRLVDQKFFHAAISVGGTTIRAINGLLLGNGWGTADLANVLKPTEQNGIYLYDKTQIQVYISPL
ncbi:DUF4157 domain-containing protein [Sphaerospermopsis kisseleviana CS-549]|uniref:DUF4157 domain-containing protein n=1 Tax=Sphaerospermopsis kisseleviana CS-549 TaxID=3021783 RepID=A0ABT4ZRG7_9CYAN|nr:DUF4157 domain-containing protein [Sphaerospermopsis kisseleviana]MDB9442004.1 DUF4157 domain-containing protein [Sphaerospermopsis kisseleviana CS-549]BAZ78769.1 hypothetical protein NIES73_00050 [Sphaerospermopsis kisseleviana NIES-73]